MTSDAEVDFQALRFPCTPAPDARTRIARYPVVVVGAGPVGLTAAIDLAQQGTPVVLLDDDDRLSAGSRAICFAKRTLEIFDRLGCGAPIVHKGVDWHVGKVFFRGREIYSFDLLPQAGHRRPAFVNLQQYYVEGYLVRRALELPNIDVRWQHRVAGLIERDDAALLSVETPDGDYRLEAQYVVAADGYRSALRKALGLELVGQTFRDRFLIADVKMKAEFPPERWFWFDPPFHESRSALLHRQPDDVWRIDFQLGPEADPVAERQPERVIPRVRALLGDDREFTLEWASVYSFSCARLEKFRVGRVLFAGDAAHTVSPFGARGANSGIADAEGLAWKLRLVLEGRAPDALLDSYDAERGFAAGENIRASARATDFITPKTAVSGTFRDAVLLLAGRHPFARRLVNSGRLSTATALRDSPLNTPDADRFDGPMFPGAVADDAPVVTSAGEDAWFLQQIGNAFAGVYFADAGAPPDAVLANMRALATQPIPVHPVLVAEPRSAAGPWPQWLRVLSDRTGMLRERYDARPGTYYLFRPDQYVCGRRRSFDAAWVARAVRSATSAA